MRYFRRSAGVYVLVDMSEDGLALAMAGQDKKKTGEHRNVTQFREWVLGNISVYKSHPALGGYYGCDDCCHTVSECRPHSRVV
jgi:hypothetical protein